MAIAIQPPDNVPGAVSTGYGKQNILLQLVSTGFIAAGFTNMDNDQAPRVMAGSIIEVNGVLHKCEVDEDIIGPPKNIALSYIYAAPNGPGQCRFVYSVEGPTLQPLKGGLYKGNDRCIGNVFYADGRYIVKNINTDMEVRMMGSQNILKDEIFSYPVGTLLHTVNAFDGKKKIRLQSGRYCFVCVGAGGGGGGGGGDGIFGNPATIHQAGYQGGQGGQGGKIIVYRKPPAMPVRLEKAMPCRA